MSEETSGEHRPDGGSDHPLAPEPAAEIERNAAQRRAHKSAARIIFLLIAFVLIYAAIIARLTQLGIAPEEQYEAKLTAQDQVSAARPDILDRNGEVLATDVQVPSLFAEPRKLVDVDEATELLAATIPDLDSRELREKLASGKGFVWLKREITPQQQAAVYKLGLPGVGFLMENKRIYPNGPTVSHVLGSVNIDNQGIAGIEKYIDNKRGLSELQALGFAAKADDLKPVSLSIDLRAQHVMRDELTKGMEHFKAKAAAGAIMDVNTGEMISLVSLPDFDPNNPADALDPNRINRINVGVFEMGSTFKALTMAMGIESGKFTTNSLLDARSALRYGRFSISDYHAQKRMLTLPEVFTYSSNIGSARIALALGVDAHKAFLRKVGQFERLVTELPENAAPILPAHWGELNTVTVAFGHGIAVAPLQALMAVAAMMNGGELIKPTFLVRNEEEAREGAPRVLRQHTSDVMRYLLRLNGEKGSAKKADIPGYLVGGKTGTAEKVVGGRYSRDRLFTTFMAVFPFGRPKYLVLCLYDEPKGLPETFGYATAAWNAGVTTGKVIGRVAPLLGMEPRLEPVPNDPPPLFAPATLATAEP